jgi:hypothetical protein
VCWNKQLESEESMSLKIPALSPGAVVCGTALIVVAAFAVAISIGFGEEMVDPRVTTEYRQGSEGKRTAAPPVTVSTMINGEVARTADRIGEAAALALAAGLYAANEQLHGRDPGAVRDLLSGIAKQNLMPPDLKSTNVEGVLVSSCRTPSTQCGTLMIRYRPRPFGIEVVSIGGAPEDGPALIVRLPDETSDRGEAKLFMAQSLTELKIPGPFAPTAEIIASGWSPERWRSLK